MKMKLDPREIWAEYSRAQDYNASINLYDTVKQNENFFIGKQWEGLDAPDLPKTTLNFLHRVVAYFVAMLVSDDIGVSLASHSANDPIAQYAALLKSEVEKVLENAQVRAKNRHALRDAAVCGDGCMYWWWDQNMETGQAAKGGIRFELIPNINCHFGNPYITSAQDQPFIILARRRMVREVREEAEQRNASEDIISRIAGDTDENQGESGDSDSMCTVLIKLWRKDGYIWAQECTKDVVLRGEWNTTLKLYPIAWMNWERVRASYHGQAALTGLIPNQIAVNKLFAMTVRSVELNAFPKVVFDKTRFPDGWNNRVGSAIGVTGDVTGAFADAFRGADVSGQITDIIDRCVSMTRDFMGASDAALGNVKPDNTSAIIAVQQASAVPLELQRLTFYDFVEQYVRGILDMMRAYYGVREVDLGEAANGTAASFNGLTGTAQTFDFSALEQVNMQLKIDIGAGAYYSEITQMRTMDNLYSLGLIPDPTLYLKGIPDKYVPSKPEIIAALEQAMQQSQPPQSLDSTTPRTSAMYQDSLVGAPETYAQTITPR